MKKAMFWRKKGDSLLCTLCPHRCLIGEGRTGICRQRKNIGGKLYSLNYGNISGMSMDAIEKKPLYHFLPGSSILSVGTVGCNLNCEFCQNWRIAHGKNAETHTISPHKLVEIAQRNGSVGIAYTYNEPSIWYEFVYETSQIAKSEGLVNVLVTNGFISKQPLKSLLPYIDAMNIDVKSFTDTYYNKYCKAELKPVLETVEISALSTHIEITTLIVDGLNDQYNEIDSLTSWLASINKSIPFHLSRYFPNYKMEREATPVDTLVKLKQKAQERLDHVYLGNIWGHDNNTYCPGCNNLLIDRNYQGRVKYIDNGKCEGCGTAIYGIF